MKNVNVSARLFIATIVTAGMASLVGGLIEWQSSDPLRFLSFVVITAVASRLKVKLPGTNGNMSVNLPFILLAVASLSFPEAVVIAGVSAFVQGWPKRDQSLRPVQALFNVSILMMAVAVAEIVYRVSALIPSLGAKSLLIASAAAAFFFADTLPLAAVISLTENLDLLKVWREMLELTFSYFALSAGIAAIAATASHYAGWRAPLLMLPVMIGTYFSYKRYFRMPVAVAMTNLQFTTLPAGAREKAELYR
jgi:hypothetical protein